MGELCLRWAMKLPADVPIVWPDRATPAMERIRAALLSLDDVQDLPRLSFSFLAGRTGLADATVRKALQRIARSAVRAGQMSRQAVGDDISG
jgi:hypothetical protein